MIPMIHRELQLTLLNPNPCCYEGEPARIAPNLYSIDSPEQVKLLKTTAFTGSRRARKQDEKVQCEGR